MELGGTDQKFNLLVGRALQKEYGMSSQAVITMPILEGLDGVNKMSKSLGNYVGIFDAPSEMFGKIMSISDELMWRWFLLLSFRPMEEIEELKKQAQEGRNPRDIKFELSEELVARFHNAEAAQKAKEEFINRFAKGQLPENIEEVVLEGELPIANALKNSGMVESTSEALRLIKSGSLKIDGEKIEDKDLILKSGFSAVVQLGKRRILKITIQ